MGGASRLTEVGEVSRRSCDSLVDDDRDVLLLVLETVSSSLHREGVATNLSKWLDCSACGLPLELELLLLLSPTFVEYAGGGGVEYAGGGCGILYRWHASSMLSVGGASSAG